MPVPSPPVPLNNGCSAIYNNTLYSYSADAFQSLPLIEGAKWERLSPGIAVSGGVCVQATPKDSSSPPALYIVGGNANSSQSDYQGLQRYIFQEKKWESVPLSVSDTRNRLYHGAVYLNESSTILMYAGRQDGTRALSSQTFTISTLPPYQVLAYESIAPPAISPLLVAWSDSEAAMIGGTETNTKVMVFSPSKSWTDSASSLEVPLKNSEAVKAVVVKGDDGSKSLYTFDMSVSPNEVNRTVLIDGLGNPVNSSTAIVGRNLAELNSRKTKRAHLSIAEWPAYNATLAPTTTRKEYSIAQGSDDLVVFSGGNDDDMFCMFNARENCWENATALMTGAQAQIQQDIKPSTTLTSSATQAPTETSSTLSPSTTDGFNYKLLGIVLGSIVGFAMLILVACLCVRGYSKRRAFVEAGHQRRASGISDEKDPMDFADRGISLDTANRYQRHAQKPSQVSNSSMAILMGNVKTNQPRSVPGRRDGSNVSDSSSAFNKKYKSAISNPIPQVRQAQPDGFLRAERHPVVGATRPNPPPAQRAAQAGSNKQGSTRRSSGWNRYWSGGSALNILGFGNKRTTYGSHQSDHESVYSEGPQSRVTQTSAIVPPLNVGHHPGGRMSQVASGSPTISHQNKEFRFEQGVAAHIERSNSVSSVSSYGDPRDAFSSGVPASVVEEPQTWTPFGGSGWGGDRTASSVYTNSNYAPTPPRTTMIESSNQTTSILNSAPCNEVTPKPPSDMSWLNLAR